MNRKTSFFFICILFILSGVAALVYQIAWFKHLGYFLGNSTYSQAVVLATFMGGIALGSWWWGRKADQHANPLRLFAWLEIFIGLYCFFYQPIFEGIEKGFTSTIIAGGWASDAPIVLGLKLLASAAAIFLPTVLMGGTLPVLVKYLSIRIEEVGKNVALLYFINSAGAVIGSFLAGFYLLGSFGITTTTYFGASLDLLVGLIFLIPAYGLKVRGNRNVAADLDSSLAEAGKKNITSHNEPILNFSLSERQYKIVLLTAIFSGFSAMLYEVVWLRLLIPILSSTTYSFTIILTAFISGITIGSIVIYWVFRKVSNPYRLLGFCQLGIVISVLLTLQFYERLPYYIWKAIGEESATDTGYQLYLGTQFLYVFLLLLPPTIFMGMSLPIASKISVRRVKETGAVIGNVFALNTLGTVVGSLLTGLVLIPFVGILNAIMIGLLVNLSLALFILADRSVLSKVYLIFFLIVLTFSFFIFYRTVDSERWAHTIMLSEIPRELNRNKAPKNYEQFLEKKINPNREILYYEEGIGGTIVVCKSGKATFLYTNGKGDANSVSDIQTQASLGHTPMILHPKPDSVFVIGFGAGHTVGSVMTHPEIDFAQVAEISPEVIEASQFFEHVNERPLVNKKLQVIKDDGVAALRLSPFRYDIIISQPSNPWSAGVGNLFTKEFFADCKSKLKPGGFVAQWFGLYEMDERSLKLILRTAYSEFNHLSLWHLGSNDILLLCSEAPFNFDLETIAQHYELVKQALSADNIEIHSLPIFLSQQINLNDQALKVYAGEGPLNLEDLPLMELWTPRAYFLNESPEEFESIMDWAFPLEQGSLLQQYYSNKNGVPTEEKTQISLFKALQSGSENVTFMNTFSKLSGERNPNISDKYIRDPQVLQHGWIDNKNRFHALDSIHPNQKVSAWSCCAAYQKTQALTYQWTSWAGDTLTKNINQQTSWLTAWVELDHKGPLTEGNWNLSVFKDKKRILTHNFIVSSSAPVKQPAFMHGEISIGIHRDEDIAYFDRVNPMQKLAVVTKGLPFGKREMINVKWRSPSGKEINQVMIYEPHYEIAWRYMDAALPLEEGNWMVEVQNMNGKTYLSKTFMVDRAVKLVKPQ